jgi:hypothetical protein
MIGMRNWSWASDPQPAEAPSGLAAPDAFFRDPEGNVVELYAEI